MLPQIKLVKTIFADEFDEKTGNYIYGQNIIRYKSPPTQNPFWAFISVR